METASSCQEDREENDGEKEIVKEETGRLKKQRIICLYDRATKIDVPPNLIDYYALRKGITKYFCAFK